MTEFSPFHSWSAASPYALALGLAALLCVLLAVEGWRRRARPGGLQFSVMMAGAATWALLYSFELTTPSLTGKVFWAKTEYAGIALLPVAWFLFARSYTGATKRLSLRLLALISLIPTLTVVLAASNESHVLLWSELYLNTAGSFSSLTLVHGPWFWVHMIYSYGLLALGSYVLLRTAYRYPRLYRRQAVMLFIAAAAPWVGNGLSIFLLLPRGGIDITPFAFTITGVALLLAMSRLRLLSLLPALLPTARSQVLQKMKDGVLILDVDGKVVNCNPAAGRMLASENSELMGKPAANILGQVVPATLGANEASESQFEITLGEDDSKRYFDVVSSALGLGSGGGMGRLLVLRDVTERKHMERALRESEERYRVLAEATPDCIYSYDTELKLTGINQAAAQMLGLKPQEALGKALEELGFTKDTLSQWKRMTREVLDSGGPVREVVEVIMPDGESHAYETTLQPVFHDNGEIAGIRGGSRDITERKRAGERLGESEERFRGIFEQGSVGIALVSPDQCFIRANPAFCEMLGYEECELVGKTIAEVTAGEHVRPSLEDTHLLYSGKLSALSLDKCYLRKDGELVWGHVSAALIRDKDGKPVGSVAVVQDITERKQAEEALRESEEQLRQAHKMEAVGQLAGGIAHDFNNLLTAIIGNSSLALAAMAPEDPNRELIADIQEVGERAAGLTRQILAYSRRQILKPEVRCLNEIVLGIGPLLRRTLGEDYDLHFSLAPDLGQTEVDPHQMEQVLMNLALNARDAMPEGGHLTVETANVKLDRRYARTHPEVEPGRYVMLAVSDTGCGMDEHTKSRIFEPFFTTKEVGKGTGLGLSTAFGIVRQSGGSVSVYSEPGKGSTFKVYLPASQTAVAPEADSPEEGEMKSGSETILVVEDEASVRELVVRILSRSGYDVLEAGSASEVDAALKKGGSVLHLLLTDVVLPGGRSGREVAEALAAGYPNLPVIFMSGYTRDSVVHNGRLDHGIEFLEKPFAPEALLGKVRAVLDAGTGKPRQLAKSGSS